MAFEKCTALFVLALVAVEGAKLPSYFTPCTKGDPGFNDCVIKEANNGITEFVKGDPTLHIVPLNPLHVAEIHLDVGGNLKIDVSDADIFGLEKLQAEHLDWDFDKKQVVFNVRSEKLAVIGTYDVDGKILILPIKGNGPCNITFMNPLIKFKVDYDLEQRKGKEYITVTKGDMTYEVDRVFYQLDNLFNGDKVLGEETNNFLNENWKEVNEQMGTQVADAVTEVILSVVKEFFKRVPTDELFK